MATPFEIQQSINDSFQRRAYLETRNKALTQAGVSYSVNGLSKQMVRSATKSAVGETSEILTQISLFYLKSVRSRRTSLVNAYEEVGQQANKAVASRFRSGVTGPSGYRSNAPGKWRRDSGGKLARALASPEMFKATPSGIGYVNIPWLDSQARQWYRLNFGAGPRGGASQGPKAQRVVFFGQQTDLNVGLQGLGPSKGFSMPGGVFRGVSGDVRRFDPSRRGKDEFSPANYLQGRPNVMARSSGLRTKSIVTQGITARNFLDAGTSVIARGIPNVTTRMLREVLQESFEAGGAIGPPALAGLDTKNIGILLSKTELEVDKLTSQARGLSSALDKLL